MEPAEAITARAVNRELYIKGQVNRITRQLLDLEVALVDDLAKAMARLSAKDETRLQQGSYTTDRLKRLIDQVQQFSIDWAAIVRNQVDSGGLDLIEAEIEFEHRYLATFATDATVGLSLDATISPRQIFTAAKARPFGTRVLKEAYPEMARNVRRRVVDSLRISYQAGESIGQASARLRSDRQLGINRNGAEAMARTVLAHYANSAANDSLQLLGVDKFIWVSTLDSRTTDICKSLDGQVFRFDNPRAPRVPRHVRCRSSIAAYLGEEIDGERTSNGAEGKVLVPAGMNYEQWLRKQPKSFAREILGPTRYKIWNSGEPVTKFTDRYATRAFTSTELKQQYSNLFPEAQAA